jgi:hypothetical protein
VTTPNSSSVRADIGAFVPSAPLPPRSSPAERHAAALTVARYSTDLDDCRGLLAMLGLRDEMPAASS